jgi:hypothetical protein
MIWESVSQLPLSHQAVTSNALKMEIQTVQSAMNQRTDLAFLSAHNQTWHEAPWPKMLIRRNRFHTARVIVGFDAQHPIAATFWLSLRLEQNLWKRPHITQLCHAMSCYVVFCQQIVMCTCLATAIRWGKNKKTWALMKKEGKNNKIW